MDPVTLIEDSIVNGSDGFFDEPDDRENLHVTIRIAWDVYQFLLNAGEQPASGEIDYVIGTIRSGLDRFFALTYACAIINAPRGTWNIDAGSNPNFGSLRADFIVVFERFVESVHASWVERFAWLLALVRLEILFIGHHFPSALLDRSQ